MFSQKKKKKSILSIELDVKINSVKSFTIKENSNLWLKTKKTQNLWINTKDNFMIIIFV